MDLQASNTNSYEIGQEYYWKGCYLTVTKVADDNSWADFRVENESEQWSERLPLPLPFDLRLARVPK